MENKTYISRFSSGLNQWFTLSISGISVVVTFILFIGTLEYVTFTIFIVFFLFALIQYFLVLKYVSIFIQNKNIVILSIKETKSYSIADIGKIQLVLDLLIYSTYKIHFTNGDKYFFISYKNLEELQQIISDAQNS